MQKQNEAVNHRNGSAAGRKQGAGPLCDILTPPNITITPRPNSKTSTYDLKIHAAFSCTCEVPLSPRLVYKNDFFLGTALRAMSAMSSIG